MSHDRPHSSVCGRVGAGTQRQGLLRWALSGGSGRTYGETVPVDDRTTPTRSRVSRPRQASACIGWIGAVQWIGAVIWDVDFNPNARNSQVTAWASEKAHNYGYLYLPVALYQDEPESPETAKWCGVPAPPSPQILPFSRRRTRDYHQSPSHGAALLSDSEHAGYARTASA